MPKGNELRWKNSQGGGIRAMHAAMTFRGKRLGDMAMPMWDADIQRMRKVVDGKRTDRIAGLHTKYDKSTAPLGTFKEY